MKNVTLPIIINAKGDVELYEDLHDAELDMEPIDVENGEFKVYDGQGLVLIPRVFQKDRIDHVYLEVSSPPEYRPDQLREILRHSVSYLVRKGTLATVSEEQVWRMDVDELIACEREVIGDFNKRKKALGWRWYWPWGRGRTR